MKDNCPFQRVSFIGSSTVNITKGIELLDSLTAGLELEKSRLIDNGAINNKLRIRVANMIEEAGTFEVPISKGYSDEYVTLASSICTIRADLYSKKDIFKSEAARNRALITYDNLLNHISTVKKKLAQK